MCPKMGNTSTAFLLYIRHLNLSCTHMKFFILEMKNSIKNANLKFCLTLKP